MSSARTLSFEGTEINRAFPFPACEPGERAFTVPGDFLAGRVGARALAFGSTSKDKEGRT